MNTPRWIIECVDDAENSIIVFGAWPDRQPPLPIPFWEVRCGCGQCHELRVCRDEATAHRLMASARIPSKCLKEVAPTHCEWLFCDDWLFDVCGSLWPPELLNGRRPYWRTE